MRNEDPPIQIRKLTDDDRDYRQSTTAAERPGMVWQLTLDAWAFKRETIGEFQKDAVRIIRLEDK